MNLAIFAFLCFSITICKCSPKTEPVVALPLGKIRGLLTDADGYYKFHNIPYAKPPIGDRRFESPIPFNQSWDEEMDATKPMISCIHFEKNMEPSGSEDCLYLHVVTPDISCKQKMYPVRVQIHGGSFRGGSPDNVDTSILVKRGIVIVTMGYRLGPLGFLSSGDKVIPGNNGLKDQRLAIMWVKENIVAFCGDRNNILLAGASAGGASAHMHLLKKSTENYVNAVASHNGVSICPWVIQPKPQELSRMFADWLYCPSDLQSMKACLKAKSVEELREATLGLLSYKNNPLTVFVPVVETSDSEDPFIFEHPEDIMRKGQAANITWLVGYTEREGSCAAASFLSLNECGVPEIGILNERWEELAPSILFFNLTMSSEEKHEYSGLLKDTYMGGKEFSEENYRLLENMFTDVLFNDDIKKAIFLHRKYCPGRVYAYYYKYPHEFVLGNLLSGRKDVSFGADHMADSIFTIPLVPLKPSVLTDRDRKVSEKLLGMYLDWANTGVLAFGGRNLPLNTPTDDAILTINEQCYSVDGCSEMGESGCSCYAYD